MKLQIAFGLLLLVVFMAFATDSRADSDAYFCTSKGYLAYETRKGVTPGAVGHVLKVVRFEPKRGIHLGGEVTLLDFQVYHMICTEERIEISGWRNVFTKYVIELEKSGELKNLGPTEFPGRQWSDAANDGPEPGSLGLFGPDLAPLPLGSLDPEHEYQLLRSLSGRAIEEGWEFHSKSELIQLDLKGNITQRFVLYERRNVEHKE